MIPISDPAPAMAGDLKSRIRSVAAEAGFEAVRVTTPGAIPAARERLAAFLAAGHHGDMDWMAAKAGRRGDPATLWPEARSVVMLALSYAPPGDPLAHLSDGARAAISVYARGKDYHDVVKTKLKRVAGWLHRETGAAVVPWGAGSSVVGGVTPDVGDGYAGTVSVDLSRLNKVLEVDENFREADQVRSELEAALRSDSETPSSS